MPLRQSLLVIFILVVPVLVSACTASPAAVPLAPVSELPAQMQQAPASVRTAYQFAVAHPDALTNVPCYCGCGAIGHTSNLACYIKGNDAAGKPIFDDHALGCSICVDIALDVRKLTGEGKSAAEVREEIVRTYSAFGPGNQ